MTGDPETERRAAALADLDRRPTVDIVRAVVRGHHDWRALPNSLIVAGAATLVCLIVGALAADALTRWGATMAANVIYTLPVVLVFIVLRKHLMRGTTAGAVKA